MVHHTSSVPFTKYYAIKIIGFYYLVNIITSGADAIKKFTPSLGIPYLGV